MYKDLWRNTWLSPVSLLHLLPLQILLQALAPFGPGCPMVSLFPGLPPHLPCRCRLVLQVSQSSTIPGGLSQHPRTFGAPCHASFTPVCFFRIAVSSVTRRVTQLPGPAARKDVNGSPPLGGVRLCAFFHWPPAPVIVLETQLAFKYSEPLNNAGFELPESTYTH